MTGHDSDTTRTASETAAALFAAMHYLEVVVSTRLALVYTRPTEYGDIWEIPGPDLGEGDDRFSSLVRGLGPAERIAFFIALSPYLHPHLFDQVMARVLDQSGEFPEIGGVRGKNHRGFLPTGETVLFVLAGGDLGRRIEAERLFAEDHRFAREHLLWLQDPGDDEPPASGRLLIDPEMVALCLHGRVPLPRFSLQFPAKRVVTEMDWEDLVLSPTTRAQVHELEDWLNHGAILREELGMGRLLKPGFRALFYGPPGTGKTLTAGLLGRYTGREVYKVDLSMVVSKFIGETEKNLGRLLDRAARTAWILFFDEADALFGKRTGVRDAHDKYANQEVAYLLQRVEEYDGLVILASNLKSNIDDAFMRRFQAVIHFPPPSAAERQVLWEKAIPAGLVVEEGVDLPLLARKHEITGAHVVNVVQYAGLRALARGERVLRQVDLQEGIRREFNKEGRIGG